jgi:hypothetical protein
MDAAGRKLHCGTCQRKGRPTDSDGTVPHAAPELGGDPPHSPKNDVFASGLIHYEIAVGRPVFDADLPASPPSSQILKEVILIRFNSARGESVGS